MMALFSICNVFLLLIPASRAGIFDDVFGAIIPKKTIHINDMHVGSCERDQENLVHLRTFQASTNAHGDIVPSGLINFKIPITSPIVVKVTMKRKVLGLWVKVPCINEFGSCTYDDLCEYGYSVDTPCPAEFVEDNIPCRCPIKKGNYKIPEIKIPVPESRWTVITTGTYHATVHLVNDNKEVACYSVAFALSSK